MKDSSRRSRPGQQQPMPPPAGKTASTINPDKHLQILGPSWIAAAGSWLDCMSLG
jgi:hypothetical protein